jgi:signal peptidase I
VEIHDDHLVINGETVELRDQGPFVDKCYGGMGLREETLGEHTHQVMTCRSQYSLTGAPLPDCNRKKLRRDIGGWFCQESPPGSPQGSMRDHGNHRFEVVPPGHYLMIGDNRDNSEDSRVWHFVPDKNLVGKATRIWFNFDQQRDWKNVINWSRIGDGIP